MGTINRHAGGCTFVSPNNVNGGNIVMELDPYFWKLYSLKVSKELLPDLLSKLRQGNAKNIAYGANGRNSDYIVYFTGDIFLARVFGIEDGKTTYEGI